MTALQLNTRKKAFKKLFSKALSIKKNPQVTVIYDEEFLDYFRSLSEVIEEMLLPVTYIFMPVRYQQLLQKKEHFETENGIVTLPAGIKAAISNSDIVLNMLNGDINTSRVRGAILSHKKNFNCKVVHCPGISDKILDLVLRSPYQKILLQSEMMAWALGNTHTASLRSAGADGKEYVLDMTLDGWDNEPFMSSGIIFEGSWGNIPPGETFCCPNPASVSGKICINGSLPNIVFKKAEEVILTFKKGKLIQWDAKPGSAPDKFFKELEKEADERKDDNWNTFAELGIGLNPAIKSLTGNSLFDEKIAGTIHVAIGDNVVFGHNVESHIHADMVVIGPTLLLDDRKVIHNGIIDTDIIRQWRSNMQFNKVVIDNSKIIAIDSAKIKVSGMRLQRRFENGGRVGMVEILNNKYKKAIDNVKETLESVVEIHFKDLAKKAGPKQRKNLMRVLEILYHYKAIEIK